MKLLRTLMALAMLMVISSAVFAQEKEMTEEEWQAEINRLTEKKADLTSQLNALQSEVNNLKNTNASLQSYDDCMKELNEMVGASDADIDNFRAQLHKLRAQIARKESPKEDRQAALDALKSNPISALPEFFDQVHNMLQKQLDAWVEKPKEILYTVVRGDHLWGIAKKKEHYGNPFVWPKIYNTNRDQIKNPDLIYPKQVFKIPNLTEEEKAKYDKILSNYKPAPKER
ncbi:MAG: LysM peptidoglycan-binding domain-containing protein [Ignavibacteria bacterium]|nr:MAG: LysM peptidoglycan-binding domain-containing protein [Ignavibacteria bacterium]